MSQPQAKERRSRVKDLRQGVVEQKSIKAKSRGGNKPWKIEGEFMGRVVLMGRYKTENQAKMAFSNFERKRSFWHTLAIVFDGEAPPAQPKAE